MVNELKPKGKRVSRNYEHLVYHKFTIGMAFIFTNLIDFQDLKSVKNPINMTESSHPDMSDQSSEVKANFYKADMIDITKALDFDKYQHKNIVSKKRKSGLQNYSFEQRSASSSARSSIYNLNYSKKAIIFTASKLRQKIHDNELIKSTISPQKIKSTTLIKSKI